jgi:hypothetical protein
MGQLCSRPDSLKSSDKNKEDSFIFENSEDFKQSVIQKNYKFKKHKVSNVKKEETTYIITLNKGEEYRATKANVTIRDGAIWR